MLNAHLKEYLFNCYDKMNEILDNDMNGDEEISNKFDYYYIHEKEKEFDNNFLIQIPKLKSKDIVLLYMQFGAKKKEL